MPEDTMITDQPRCDASNEDERRDKNSSERTLIELGAVVPDPQSGDGKK